LYVAFDYIISKSKNISFNKIKSYQSFFDADNSSELVNLINSFLSKKKINLFKEIEIDIIKGSIYKIKRYFWIYVNTLDNNLGFLFFTCYLDNQNIN